MYENVKFLWLLERQRNVLKSPGFSVSFLKNISFISAESEITNLCEKRNSREHIVSNKFLNEAIPCYWKLLS